MTIESVLGAVVPSESANSKLRLSLCLLTWNEIDGCRLDVPKLPLQEFDEVYAVDADSYDGTVEYLESRAIKVHRQPVRGYNQAYLCAFQNCTTDALVMFHPKGNIDPNEVAKFRAFFEQGYDLVVASRMIDGSQNEEDDRLVRPRKWFVLGLGILSALIWRRKGPIIWDVLHGFRGMRVQRFFAIEPLDTGLSIDLEMVVRGYRRGYRMTEFPVAEKKRVAGKTHFSAFPTGKRLLAYILHELKRSA